MSGGGLEIEKEKVKAAGRGFLEYLKRNGFNSGDIREVRLTFDATMMYVSTVLTTPHQPPREENQVVSRTDRDPKCRVSFNETVTVIPLFGSDGMGMGVGEEDKADETGAVYRRSKRLRLTRRDDIGNAVAVTTTAESKYEELERDFREKIISWTTGAKSFSITITEDHKKAIADYVGLNWIQARRCISIAILKTVEMWEPLVEAVFSQESREEQKKLVEFFRKSVAQPKNRLKPILKMLVKVHDNNCNCPALASTLDTTQDSLHMKKHYATC